MSFSSKNARRRSRTTRRRQLRYPVPRARAGRASSRTWVRAPSFRTTASARAGCDSRMARATRFGQSASAPATARGSRMNAHEYANVCFNAAGKAIEFVTPFKRRNDPARRRTCWRSRRCGQTPSGNLHQSGKPGTCRRRDARQNRRRQTPSPAQTPRVPAASDR